MAKTKTNEQIFADIRERGMMTEQEMNLLKRLFLKTSLKIMEIE